MRHIGAKKASRPYERTHHVKCQRGITCGTCQSYGDIDVKSGRALQTVVSRSEIEMQLKEAMKEELFEEKLHGSYYKNDLPFPSLKDCDGDMLVRDQKRAQYRERERIIYSMFKRDALEALGVSDHPKVDKLWTLAWEHGHASGFHDVWSWLNELVVLIKDEK